MCSHLPSCLNAFGGAGKGYPGPIGGRGGGGAWNWSCWNQVGGWSGWGGGSSNWPSSPSQLKGNWAGKGGCAFREVAYRSSGAAGMWFLKGKAAGKGDAPAPPCTGHPPGGSSKGQGGGWGDSPDDFFGKGGPPAAAPYTPPPGESGSREARRLARVQRHHAVIAAGAFDHVPRATPGAQLVGQQCLACWTNHRSLDCEYRLCRRCCQNRRGGPCFLHMCG